MHARYTLQIPKIVAAILIFALSAGCAEIVKGDAQKVDIDTGFLGEVAPGTREWLSWLQAREHCTRFGKSPEIVDLKGSLTKYKCIVEK